MATQRTELGWRGENAALAHLEKKGWKLLERHFRTRHGEIDLVMQEGKTLVFVEVKTRQSMRFGTAEEAITEQKLARIELAAERYLQLHRWSGPVRFDAVFLTHDGDRWRLQQIPIH